MTAIDHAQGAARIVTELTDRVIPAQPYRSNVLYVEDFLALAATLKAAGYPVGDQMEQIEAVSAAINATLIDPWERHLRDVDLMTADPADIAERVRQVAIDRAVQIELQSSRQGIDHRLARSAADSLQASSDAIVQAMRKRFDPAVKVIQRAAACGLTQHTDTQQLLNTGSPEAIEAYRALAPAVAELDAVAGLRNQLTTVAHVGPVEHPMAAYVTGVRSEADLESAQGYWTGESEVVQHNLPIGGTHLARVRKQRLGGAWLALVVGGYTLRLNTGAEAHAVVRAAVDGDD